jgi:predicted nucleotidyltransferase component of viral defense system
MKNFLDLPEARRKQIFEQTSERTGLPPSAIEKDWWVTLALKTIFELPFTEHIVFKGGTSLSKGWNLIERFSEDIDLAMDRKYFGFDGDISNEQVKKLRKASCLFGSGEFRNALDLKLKELGITGYNLIAHEITNSDTDPVELELQYDSVTDKSTYILPKVLIEIGARSQKEPFEKRPIQSIVGQTFSDQNFADLPFMIPLVLPQRTFLEKAFLLHELFQKPPEKIKAERLSRHLYDLEKLMDTEHGKDALQDTNLYNSIIKHREKFNPVRGIDYSNHKADKIDFVPPASAISDWEKDYKTMQESMIYGKSLKFDKLIERRYLDHDFG